MTPRSPSMGDAGTSGRWQSVDQLIDAMASWNARWWRDHELAREACSADADLLARLEAMAAAGDLVRTIDVFQRDGRWLPDRSELHESIVTRHLGELAINRSSEAFFTIGCFASGKTSILRRLVNGYRATRDSGASGRPSVIDADAIRQQIPEYLRGEGSLLVQEEAFHVAYERLLPEAIAVRSDLIIDTLGRPTSVVSLARRLSGAGWNVHVLRADAPISVCVERANRRALRTGRLIVGADFARAAADAVETLEALRSDGTLTGWAEVRTEAHWPPDLLNGYGPWADDFDEVCAQAAPGDGLGGDG